MEKIIEIPEGYIARIEGNKVIFEPKESEDERIRREIISYIKSSGAVTNPNWIAWLEKQGEISPSEEELEALRIAAYEPYKNWSEKLQSLYEKLDRLNKKIK